MIDWWVYALGTITVIIGVVVAIDLSGGWPYIEDKFFGKRSTKEESDSFVKAPKKYSQFIADSESGKRFRYHGRRPINHREFMLPDEKGQNHKQLNYGKLRLTEQSVAQVLDGNFKHLEWKIEDETSFQRIERELRAEQQFSAQLANELQNKNQLIGTIREDQAKTDRKVYDAKYKGLIRPQYQPNRSKAQQQPEQSSEEQVEQDM